MGCRSSTVYTTNLKSQCKSQNKDYVCLGLEKGILCEVYAEKGGPLDRFSIYLVLNGTDSFVVKNASLKISSDDKDVKEGQFLWGIWLQKYFSLG